MCKIDIKRALNATFLDCLALMFCGVILVIYFQKGYQVLDFLDKVLVKSLCKPLQATTDIGQWKTYQVLHFLDKVLEGLTLPQGAVDKMAATYPTISQTHNAEVKCCMLLLYCLLNITMNNISVIIHEMAHRCAVELKKKLNLRLGPRATDIFLGSLTCAS